MWVQSLIATTLAIFLFFFLFSLFCYFCHHELHKASFLPWMSVLTTGQTLGLINSLNVAVAFCLCFRHNCQIVIKMGQKGSKTQKSTGIYPTTILSIRKELIGKTVMNFKLLTFHTVRPIECHEIGAYIYMKVDGPITVWNTHIDRLGSYTAKLDTLLLLMLV